LSEAIPTPTALAACQEEALPNMKIPHSKLATSTRQMVARIGLVGLLGAACLGGLLAFGHWFSQQQMRAAAELDQLGGNVFWAWRLDDRIMDKQSPRFSAPGWILPGDSYVKSVYLINSQVDDLDNKLVVIESCRGIRDLVLNNSRITDAALVHVAHLLHVDTLQLSNTEITDAGLHHLAALKKLKRLILTGTRVTPRGVSTLQAQLPGAEIVVDFQST
jgi:hypothetical protein